jgi:hypothetical protein
MAETVNHEEVLDLLANKKITLDEAMQMLGGAGRSTTAAKPAEDVFKAEVADEEDGEVVVEKPAPISPAVPMPPALPVNNEKPGWVRIRVRELDSGRNRVTVNLPLGMVRFGLNMARRFGADSDDIDLDQLAAQLNDAEPGVLIDVQDEDSNEHVQISLA